jgi:hypothetical protein
MQRSIVTSTLLVMAACGKSADGGGAACGLAALAGPTALLSQFGVEGQTLAHPPARLPERLIARVVAGPALPAIVGRTDGGLVIGLEGNIPAAIKPGYGVLVVDQSGTARGVVVYEGLPVEGAPALGSVSIGPATLPLIGVQLDPARIEDTRCPLFPDSVAT